MSGRGSGQICRFVFIVQLLETPFDHVNSEPRVVWFILTVTNFDVIIGREYELEKTFSSNIIIAQ
jgi:hypothetical protein